MLRKTSIVFGITILGLCIVLSGGLIYLRSSLPQTEGAITLDGLKKPVKVSRDKNGVPHISSETEHDAYFALGFVHAQDRLWQMEFIRRVGAGRLAEILGERVIGVDKYTRTLGLYRIAEANYQNASPDVGVALDAYAAGVNAFLKTRKGALPVKFILLGFEPEEWRPAVSLVWGRLMALRLGRNRKNEILRAQIAKRFAENGLNIELLDQLWPNDPASAPTQIEHASTKPHPVLRNNWGSIEGDLLDDSGSNGWVVHGQKTDTGKPILANDPHLQFSAPIMWYLARINAPGLTLSGATVPGMPFTMLGHNGSIAWGVTNGGSDVEDMFVEVIDPADPRKYLTPTGSVSFSQREEIIKVKDAADVVVTIRESRHGPIVSDLSIVYTDAIKPNQVIAFASPALRSDDRTAEAVYFLNRAQDWQGFQAATELFHSPQVNILFASVDGDIGFVAAGRVPVRKAGNGRMPVMGNDGQHDWIGYIPAADLPRAFNPISGRIVNANNRITNENYPYHLSSDWALPYRAERIVEILDKQSTHDFDSTVDLQLDTLSTAARTVLPIMLMTKPTSGRTRKVFELLSEWDLRMMRERPEPLIYTVWLHNLVDVLTREKLGDNLANEYLGLVFRPAPRFAQVALSDQSDWCSGLAGGSERSCSEALSQSLERSLDEISAMLGDDIDGWRWGALHRAKFEHRILTKVPVLRRWANLSIESDGGNHTVNRGSTAREKGASPYSHTDGSGYRAIYDLSNLQNSCFMIATGQSGNFMSQHYSDLIGRWSDGKFFAINGDKDRVNDHSNRVLSLIPSIGN